MKIVENLEKSLKENIESSVFIYNHFNILNDIETFIYECDVQKLSTDDININCFIRNLYENDILANCYVDMKYKNQHYTNKDIEDILF